MYVLMAGRCVHERRLTQGAALNIEHDTRPNPKNRIPKPPKVVHDDVTVMSKSLFRSLFGRILVARVGPAPGERNV